MIIYNVTVKVDSDIETDWLTWMREVHIPDVMATGCFVAQEMLRLKYPMDDEGTTYAIQYTCRDMSQLEVYHRTYAQGLQSEHVRRYGDKAMAFRTILEKLDH